MSLFTLAFDTEDELIIFPHIDTLCNKVINFPKRVYENPNGFTFFNNIKDQIPPKLFKLNKIIIKKDDTYCLENAMVPHVTYITVIIKNNKWHEYKDGFIIPLTCEYSDINSWSQP